MPAYHDLSGIVETGRGLAASRLEGPAILRRLEEFTGFPVVLGTLNVRLTEPPQRGPAWQYLAAAEIGPDWQKHTGQAGYFLARVTIAERYRGLAFQADEPTLPGYPEDQIELFSDVRLRTALHLRYGDHLNVTLREI